MLVDAAPVQGKSTFEKEIKQNEQAKAQAAQQQAQMQKQIMQTQSQLAQATSLEKIAGAKERFTRSVANMGLEDERASRAISDRSQAALNNVKAAAEIESMSQDQLLKAFQIVKMIEEMARGKEEQVKSDDVNISMRANENASQQAPGGVPAQVNTMPEAING